MKNDTKPSISVSDLLSKPAEEVSLEVNTEASDTGSSGDSQEPGSGTSGQGTDQSSGASGQGADQGQGAAKPDAGPDKGAAEKQEIKLSRNMLTPSNWDIKAYGDKIQAIGGGHNLICTREEFNAILFKGSYLK